MRKTNPLLIAKCRNLRKRGCTLGEIIKATNLPKTTIFYHIRDIPLPLKVKKRLVRENIQRLKEIALRRKGKCLPGRIVIKPKRWTPKLIFLIAHFMFDGAIEAHSCIYNNRNKILIDRVNSLMKKVFKLQSHHWLNRITGVSRIYYSHVELARYIKEKSERLKQYIKNASLSEKKIFLRAFFDDEGSVHFDKKLVRGFQYNLEILKIIQNLLKDFDIESKIDEKYKEIVISRKPNLIKFRNKINFSKGIYINPNRKNSIWEKKLEKRKILDYIINSYKK
jgi:hypothetical protein